MKYLLILLFSFNAFAAQTVLKPDNSNTEPTSYTPIFSAGWGTVSNVNFKWWRQGARLYIEGSLTSGTISSGSGYLGFSLPPGLAQDFTNNVTVTAGSPLAAVRGRFYNVTTTSGNTKEGSVAGFSDTTGLVLTSPEKDVATGALSAAYPDYLTASNTKMYIKAEVPIVGWTNSQNAPVLVSGVTVDSQKAFRVEYVIPNNETCSSSSCNNVFKTDGTGGVSRSSTGVYSMTFTAGTYSAPPMCLVNSINRSGGSNCMLNGTITTSSAPITCYNGAGSAVVDDNPMVFCIGPR